MTKITFFKRNGLYYGFNESGHAGFADAGDDILCAAISAMTMLIVNTIEVSFNASVDYLIDEENADIRLTVPSLLNDSSDDKTKYAVSGIIRGYFLQLNDMLEDYYDYLDVCETEA